MRVKLIRATVIAGKHYASGDTPEVSIADHHILSAMKRIDPTWSEVQAAPKSVPIQPEKPATPEKAEPEPEAEHHPRRSRKH